MVGMSGGVQRVYLRGPQEELRGRYRVPGPGHPHGPRQEVQQGRPLIRPDVPGINRRVQQVLIGGFSRYKPED